MAERRFAGRRPKAKKGTFKRLIRTLFQFFPALVPTVIACIAFSAVVRMPAPRGFVKNRTSPSRAPRF